MENLDIYLKNLTGKDEQKAAEAADYLVNASDTILWGMLVEKSDFLYDFVRNNIINRIDKAVTKENFMNIIKFFDIYSVYYDDLFANILAKHANQDLTDEILELLEKGTEPQKTYAAKYFSLIHDTVSLETLSKYAFCDNEHLSFNSAEALGQMQDDVSFDIACSLLKSDDDFEKLKAVKFFTAYGRNYPFEAIFNAVQNSKMPENIAGQIPYMESLLILLNSKYKKETLAVIDNIISGFGEILALSDIFQFELYEITDNLISINNENNDNAGKIAKILLSTLSKFTMLCENPEYMFDEDKNTKYEISSLLKLLQSRGKEFWNKQKMFVLNELKESDERILAVLPVISEFRLKDAQSAVKNLLNSSNEAVACEALSTLKNLNALDNIDFNSIINRIKNPNIKAVMENLVNNIR